MQIYQTKLLNKFSSLQSYFTTKLDGNLAFHVGEDEQSVINNHIHLANKLSYEYKKVLHMKQIHSNSIHKVEDKDNFFNPYTCDALITDKLKTPLMVMVADCAPLLFYDKKNKVIAVAHAGRAGAFKNIIQNLINSFIHDFQSKPENIYVSVGVSIKECCYEVGDEIYNEAKELDLEYALTKKENRFFLNINSILKSQLLQSGVTIENIEFLDGCSRCLDKEYFSYRREKQTGRFAGIIWMD